MTFIALGCSHTAGVGIDPADCYVNVLAVRLGYTVKNLGVAGGNCNDVVQQLVQELKRITPKFVIAQWPNPLRRTTWFGNVAKRETVQNASTAFHQLLRASELNFHQPWIESIVIANMLCELTHVPCINIMIEDVDTKYHAALAVENIVLHVDRKLPGQTWLMDSAANDNLHHSAACHKQWAERILELLK